MRFRFAFPLVAASALAVSYAPLVARPLPTPEQRIDRLEKQLRQVQRQVFPKGQPADTAGFSDEPAASQSSVSALGSRLDSIEQQMTGLVRAAEENGNRLSVIEADLARLRADQERRQRAIDSSAAGPASSGDEADEPASPPAGRASMTPPPAPKPKVELPASSSVAATADPSVTDPGEAAYDAGYQLWNSGKYDQAIKALNAMATKYPGHRRVSWAYNLAGRALLDKGQPRAAAEALLANYRRDPKGERAQDSLYYLGQSLMKLGQPSQACKAYAELEDVYGAGVRAPLRAMLPAAKAEAKCS